jgi:peptidoglycan/LPS O-acetylase OafA/YrhL
MLNSSELISTTKRDNISGQNLKFRLEFLDGIRGLSALYVTAYHLLAWNLSVASFPLPIKAMSTLFRFGHSSVSIFIVISGFSLMLGILTDPKQKIRGGFSGYIIRRSKRIMPPYYAAMFLSLIFLYVEHQFFPVATENDFASSFRLDTIVSHSILIHNLNPAWSNSINFTHWSVATEWQIYFCLPLIFLPLYQRFGTFVMVSAGIVIGILPGFFTWGKDVYVACPWYIGLFSIGMLGAVWANKIIKNPNANYHRLISRLFLGAFIVTLVSFRIGGDGQLLDRFPLPLTYIFQSGKDDGVGGMVLAFVLYLTWTQVSRKRGIWANWLLTFLSGQKVKFLATFSYSLYLTHAIIVSLWSSIVEPNLSIDGSLQWCVRAVIVLPMTICFAYVFSLLFEAPSQRLSQRV